MKEDLGSEYSVGKWIKVNQDLLPRMERFLRKILPPVIVSTPKALVIALIGIGLDCFLMNPAERIPVKEVSLYADHYYHDLNLSVEYLGTEDEQGAVLVIKKRVNPVSRGIHWYTISILFLVSMRIIKTETENQPSEIVH